MGESTKIKKFIEKVLVKIGIIKRYAVDKKEMCNLAKSTCNRHCDYCAWNSEVE